eukprot:SAG22_NODE_2720_length_2282_cov_6.580428_2_plen_120_part_00
MDPQFPDRVTAVNWETASCGYSLRGTLPDSIADLARLQVLDLAFTGIEGTIPATVGGLGQLRYLNLHNTHSISGAVSGELPSLRHLELRGTQVDGAQCEGFCEAHRSTISPTRGGCLCP